MTEQYIRILAYEDGVVSVPEEWYSLAAYHVGGIINMLAAWVQSGYAIPKHKLISLSIEIDYRIAAYRRKDEHGNTLLSTGQ